MYTPGGQRHRRSGAPRTHAPGAEKEAVRINVWLPELLAKTVRDELPNINVSQILQDRLRELLGCKHRHAQCSACAAPIDLLEVRRDAKDEFYSQLLWELEDLVGRGGTAEGAARVAKEIARAHDLKGVRRPLPRPTQLQRRRFMEARWVEAQISGMDTSVGRAVS
jgi:hypothetical protein